MFWHFLKVVYSRACESRGVWIKVRKLKKIYRFTQQRQNVMILVHYLRKRCTGALRPEIFLQAGLHQISGLLAMVLL